MVRRAKPNKNHIQFNVVAFLLDILYDSDIAMEWQNECGHVPKIECEAIEFGNVWMPQMLPYPGVILQALCNNK